MDLSGVIFVVLALAWAVYLIPKTLKQHDEVARTRSIDRFSGAVRVLAHREPSAGPDGDRDAHLVVGPGATSVPVAPATEPAPVPVSVSVEPATTPERVAARRAAAKVAARRRRRVLTTLLLAVLALGVAGYLAAVPRWSAAVPALLTVAWLVLCRAQVRRETRRDARVLTRPTATPAAEARAGGIAEVVLVEDVLEDAVRDTVRSRHASDTDDTEDTQDTEDTEDTAGISVAELQEILTARAAEQVASHLSADAPERPLEVHVETQGTLWDPLPVTLPTYVGKDRARRTVRTIDLGEPGTWTSGRTVEDAQIAAQAAEQVGRETRGADADARVVGG